MIAPWPCNWLGQDDDHEYRASSPGQNIHDRDMGRDCVVWYVWSHLCAISPADVPRKFPGVK